MIPTADRSIPTGTLRSVTPAMAYVVVNIASSTVVGAVQISVPLYALQLEASVAEIGLVRGMSGLGMLLMVIPVGFLVDHYGPRRPFVVGSLLCTAVTGALAFVATSGTLALAMGLFGLFHVIKTTALSASFFANIGVIGIGRAGWFKGSIAIGLAFLGPLVSGVLLNLAPFTVLFVVLALLTLLPVFVALAVMKDHPQPRPPRTLRAGLVDQMHSFKELIHDQRIYLPLATEALSTALFASFSTFIAVIAVQQLGLPPVTVSVLMSVEGIAFIFTLFVGVSLLQRFGTAAFYVASVAVVVTSLVVLVNAGSALALIIAAALLGLGLGLTNLFIADRIGRVDGAKGKVTGLFAAAVGIGLSAGPMSGGALASLFGTGATFLAFVPAFMLLAVVALQASVQHPSPRINPGASDRG